jgi:response regulator NasT
MQTRRLSEPDAYAELRKTAMNQGKRIAEIADAVVTAHKLMGGQHDNQILDRFPAVG